MDNQPNNHPTRHLRELSDSDYVVAKGEPDIRGWKVQDGKGNTLGQVQELLCDPQARKVRYIILDLEGNVLHLEPRQVLVPIGMAELHPAFDAVTVPNVEVAQWQALPRYQKDQLSPETEGQIQQIFSGQGSGTAPLPPIDAGYYNQDQFNQSNLYRNRRVRTVIGLFTDAALAPPTFQELLHQGFSEEKIEIATRSSAHSPDGFSAENFELYFQSLLSNSNQENQFQDKIHDSQALIAVHTNSPEEAELAASILNSSRTPASALDIEVEQVNTPKENPEAATYPIIEENATVGKREVETGQTVLRSHLIERPFEENLRLREERVKIERVPVDRPAEAADFESFKEGSFELKEFAEVPIVSKEAQVVEEIKIGKEVEIREETIHDTTRKTEVQIEETKNKGTTPS